MKACDCGANLPGPHDPGCSSLEHIPEVTAEADPGQVRAGYCERSLQTERANLELIFWESEDRCFLGYAADDRFEIPNELEARAAIKLLNAWLDLQAAS